MLNEFYRTTFRKRIYASVDELQQDLDVWLVDYNTQRTHQGKYRYGKTPMQIFPDSVQITKEKVLSSA